MKPKDYALTIPAEVGRLDEVLSFLERVLEEADCPPKAQMQIAVAAEEVFVNISQYAYAPGTGTLTVQMALEPAAITLRFIDGGRPFDPLSKPDPDVTLTAEERQIGGLGIFMTKKVMDEASYEYREGKNILTLTKSLT